MTSRQTHETPFLHHQGQPVCNPGPTNALCALAPAYHAQTTEPSTTSKIHYERISRGEFSETAGTTRLVTTVSPNFEGTLSGNLHPPLQLADHAPQGTAMHLETYT